MTTCANHKWDAKNSGPPCPWCEVEKMPVQTRGNPFNSYPYGQPLKNAVIVTTAPEVSDFAGESTIQADLRRAGEYFDGVQLMSVACALLLLGPIR